MPQPSLPCSLLSLLLSSLLLSRLLRSPSPLAPTALSSLLEPPALSSVHPSPRACFLPFALNPVVAHLPSSLALSLSFSCSCSLFPSASSYLPAFVSCSSSFHRRLHSLPHLVLRISLFVFFPAFFLSEFIRPCPSDDGTCFMCPPSSQQPLSLFLVLIALLLTICCLSFPFVLFFFLTT